MGQVASHQQHAAQLDLFACLFAPAVRRPARMTSAPLLRTSGVVVVQLSIELVPRVDAEDEDDALVTAPIIHAWVSAQDCPPPKTRAPRSIFDLAASQVIAEAMCRRGFRPDPEPKTIQQAAHKQVVREGGVTRCTRLHHTDTTEWQEREAARRARQKVPKPPKKAKTIGRKLAELVGGHDGP